VYKAAQGVDNPAVSIWEISIYGGLKMLGADRSEFTATFGALTGPKHLEDRLVQSRI
jgi:hypothetical protein